MANINNIENILGINYWEYKCKIADKMEELRAAYNKTSRAYWEAKHTFYDFSDGFLYYYCFKYKIGKLQPDALDYKLSVGCPFYPKPENSECLWHAEFCNTELHPFVVFTNNPEFHFDTTSEDHMVVHCNTEKLIKFYKVMEREQLDPESIQVGIKLEYHLIKTPRYVYVLREEHDSLMDTILNSKTISIQ